MVLAIILRITRWIVAVFILLLFLTSISLYCLVSIPRLRQNLFPLSYGWGRYEMICHDMVISSAGTMHLRGVDASGPGFSIRIPDVTVSYSIFPAQVHGFIVSRPVIQVVARKQTGGGAVPVLTVKKILGMLRVEQGSLQYVFKDGLIKVSDIDLAPIDVHSQPDPGAEDILCRGTCAFSAMFDRRIVTGTAGVAMQRATAHVKIHSDDVVAILKGHPPICLSATVETGLEPDELGRFSGRVEFKDVLSVFPASMRSTGYLSKRLDTAAPVPASARVGFDRKRGAWCAGEITVPEWFFPERVRPSSPVPVNWRLKVDSTFQTGDFQAMVPRFRTSVTGSFRVLHTGGVRWKAALATDVKGFSLNMDDNHAVEGLGGGVELMLTGRLKAGKSATPLLSWRMKVSWNRGELLVYPWYFDLSKQKGTISASGSVSGGTVRLQRADLRSFVQVSLKDMVFSFRRLHSLKDEKPLSLIYGLRAPAGQISVKGPIGTIYDLLVREPFEAGHPVLDTVKPAGRLLLHVDKRGIEVGLDGNVAWQGRQVISGLKLDVLVPPEGQGCNPASLSWDSIDIPVMPVGQTDDIAGTGQAIDGATTAPQAEDSSIPHGLFSRGQGELSLSACEDRIIFGPVTIPAGSGSVRINRGQVEYCGGVTLSGLSLSGIRVEHSINGHTVAAAIGGKDLAVEFKRGVVRVKGSISIEVARGEIRVAGMWADLSGPVPRYGADIDFQDIDLSVLTSLTGFGRITGRVYGHVKGLVMSGKQPESFDLVVRSRKTRGVEQKISIKAIRNLSILGGGRGGIPIIGEFFKNFSYSKIAVSCRLKNDIFTMHGLISKGGAEYLVERGFWGGVNVINQNPGGRIAFSDMLERLKRISKSGKAEVE